MNNNGALVAMRMRRRCGGFSMVEMAVVLVVIGLIIGAVTIGRDVTRNAGYERIASQFVQAWSTAYNNYYIATGGVPADSTSTPTGQVNQGAAALCDTPLRNAFLAAGVTMPGGRSADRPDHYGYEDVNGLPHDLKVCLVSVAWSDPGASVGAYVTHRRNVLQITGVTPSLARFLDNFFDGRMDARFGQMRVSTLANSTTTTAADWPLDETAKYGGANGSGSDSSQSAEVTADLLLSR